MAKNLDYEELVTLALLEMRKCLLKDAVPFHTFLALKKMVCNDNVDLKDQNIENMHAEGKELGVRKLLATFSAQWDPVWKRNHRGLWKQHTSRDSSPNGFRFWQKKAVKTIKKSVKKTPKVLQAHLDQGHEDSEYSDDSGEEANSGDAAGMLRW